MLIMHLLMFRGPFGRNTHISWIDNSVAHLHLPHIYIKPIQTPYHRRGWNLHGDWAWQLNDGLSTTAEWSIKRLHWTISLAPIKLPQKQWVQSPGPKSITIVPRQNDWFSIDKVTPETVSYPRCITIEQLLNNRFSIEQVTSVTLIYPNMHFYLIISKQVFPSCHPTLPN